MANNSPISGVCFEYTPAVLQTTSAGGNIIEAGYVLDNTGNVTGRVFMSVTHNAATGNTSISEFAVLNNGTVISPYTGPWVSALPVQNEPSCAQLASRGLQPLW